MSTTYKINLREQEKAAHFAYILLQKKQDLGKAFERSFNVTFGQSRDGVLTFTTHEQNEENVRNGFNTLLKQFTSGTHMTKQHITDAASKSRQGNGYRSNDNALRSSFNNTPGQDQNPRAPYKFEAKTEGQAILKDLIENNDITFGIGPAGTGKTHVAIAVAIDMLNKKQVEKILLARPAQEAGEKLGYLPGDQKQKLDPYMRPLYDELTKVVGKEKLEKLMSSGVIELVPVGLMRGRTFENAFIILDEAQNATQEQTEMALTRFSYGSKMVLTGDPGQTDIPKDSGLKWAAAALDGVEGIGKYQFTSKDIIRHPVVQRVVDALQKVKDAAAAKSEPLQELDKPKKTKAPGAGA
jgi:phosphate starvation-inducible PhoH-like protein